MGNRKHLVFISYEDSEARGYATEARRVFGECGYATWVWHFDRRKTGYVFEEIAKSIRACDFFLYICTQRSDGSWGQRYERNMVLMCEKIPTIITFSEDFISDEFTVFKHNVVSPETFSAKCQEVAADLRKQQQLRSRLTRYLRENEPVEPA